jgi:hypothetical protein
LIEKTCNKVLQLVCQLVQALQVVLYFTKSAWLPALWRPGMTLFVLAAVWGDIFVRPCARSCPVFRSLKLQLSGDMMNAQYFHVTSAHTVNGEVVFMNNELTRSMHPSGPPHAGEVGQNWI